MLAPGIMGIFFGIGQFIAYYFFNHDVFKRAETKLNSMLSELI